MALDGVFDDLGCPSIFIRATPVMRPRGGSCLGVQSMKFRFQGRTSHAGAAHMNNSALDAVELMNVGVNFLLRARGGQRARIHYVITDGGVPNIVQDKAEVYYYVRAHLPPHRCRKWCAACAMLPRAPP
ncbi:MAG: hypothetical protein R2911_24630 [Caldilineaceae bacterium]